MAPYTMLNMITVRPIPSVSAITATTDVPGVLPIERKAKRSSRRIASISAPELYGEVGAARILYEKVCAAGFTAETYGLPGARGRQWQQPPSAPRPSTVSTTSLAPGTALLPRHQARRR